MQNAAAIHTQDWVEKTKKEAETEFKKWDKAKQKKWQQDYLAHCTQVANMILANSQETLGKINALKDSVKTAIDGVERIVKEQRESGAPLNDANRAWVVKSKTTVEDSDSRFNELTKLNSDNSPLAYRDGFMEKPLTAGALTADMVAKIKAQRKAGIDVSNEYGKQSPAIARLAQYRERWKILASELEKNEKTRTGQVHETTSILTKQINDLQAGNTQWDFDFNQELLKLTGNINDFFDTRVDPNPKNLGASLLKNAKLLVNSKAKAKDKAKILQRQTAAGIKLGAWTAQIKAIKGTLKTRVMNCQSLTASLREYGPLADPFRQTLSTIDTSLKERTKEVDELATKVNESIAELKK